MLYYHATFKKNEAGILERGLLKKGTDQNWECCAGCNRIYLAEDYEDAVGWMMYWFENKLYGELRKVYDRENVLFAWDMPTAAIKDAISKLPLVIEGLTVFDIDERGLNIYEHYDPTDPDEVIDWYVRKNIPKSKIHIAGYVFADEIRDRLLKSYGR